MRHVTQFAVDIVQLVSLEATVLPGHLFDGGSSSGVAFIGTVSVSSTMDLLRVVLPSLKLIG